jgi:aminoglycoside phosphotransferase (APT) family kinase protein
VIAGVRAQAALAPRGSVEDVLRRRAPLPAADAPFRSLHGDVWTGNVLWHGGRPAFVDWEYARPGDPAEELAYLIEMDALDDGQARALLEAYDVPEVAARVPAWRPLMALSAGLWYAELGVEDRARTLLAQAAAR